MKTSLPTRSARALAAGALSAALLTSAVATASAAPTPTPSPTMSAMPSMSAKPSASPSHRPARAAAIAIRTNRTSVRSGHTVVFTGRTTGLPVGSRLELQRLQGTKWVTLRTATVKRGGTEAFTLKVTGTGKQMFRLVQRNTVSPTVTVTVR